MERRFGSNEVEWKGKPKLVDEACMVMIVLTYGTV